MAIYAGLDVSDKTTHICVVDVDGKVLRRDVVASDPDVLAKWLNKHCAELARVVLETGTLSTFLYHGLVERGVAVECICARHAKGVLSARVNKSDVHDAEGLAQLARTGWYKRVHMKASATHIDRAALRIRAQLITARTSMANQLRGLLKLFGLRMGTARTPGRRAERLSAFYARRPDLKALFAPLIASMEAIEEQLRASNRLLNDRAKADEVCNRLMGVPGVGQENGRSQRRKTCQNSRRTQARRITPFALAERGRVSLGLIPGVPHPDQPCPGRSRQLCRGSNLVWDSETSISSARPRS